MRLPFPIPSKVWSRLVVSVGANGTDQWRCVRKKAPCLLSLESYTPVDVRFFSSSCPDNDYTPPSGFTAIPTVAAHHHCLPSKPNNRYSLPLIDTYPASSQLNLRQSQFDLPDRMHRHKRPLRCLHYFFWSD